MADITRQLYKPRSRNAICAILGGATHQSNGLRCRAKYEGGSGAASGRAVSAGKERRR
jgi:hypothetical protein